MTRRRSHRASTARRASMSAGAGSRLRPVVPGGIGRGVCPVCGGGYAYNRATRTLRAHKVDGERCEGSGT